MQGVSGGYVESCLLALEFVNELLQPIPLELLLIIATDESGMHPVVSSRPQRNNSNPNSDRARPHPPILPVKFEGGGKTGFSITFVHWGRKFYQMTLWAATHANHRKWIETITRQQDVMRERSQFFRDEHSLGRVFLVGESCELRYPVQ